jgi:hypothetical protein
MKVTCENCQCLMNQIEEYFLCATCDNMVKLDFDGLCK